MPSLGCARLAVAFTLGFMATLAVVLTMPLGNGATPGENNKDFLLEPAWIGQFADPYDYVPDHPYRTLWTGSELRVVAGGGGRGRRGGGGGSGGNGSAEYDSDGGGSAGGSGADGSGSGGGAGMHGNGGGSGGGSGGSSGSGSAQGSSRSGRGAGRSQVSARDRVVVLGRRSNQVEGVLYALNAGGDAYTSAEGVIFEADAAHVHKNSNVFSLGVRSDHTDYRIHNTADDYLYTTERYGRKFAYAFEAVADPAAPGGATVFSIHLMFAEVFFDARGNKIFSISVCGATVLEAVDIYDLAGNNAALDVKITIQVEEGGHDMRVISLGFRSADRYVEQWIGSGIVGRTDGGMVDVVLEAVEDNAKLCALVVYAGDHPLPLMREFDPDVKVVGLANIIRHRRVKQRSAVVFFAVNAGGGHHVANDGTLYSADNAPGSTSVYNKLPDNYFIRLADGFLYESERVGQFHYDFAVPVVKKDVIFTVRLQFAEVAFREIGERVFNVLVEDTVIVENLDIVKEVGHDQPFDVRILVKVRGKQVVVVSTTYDDGIQNVVVSENASHRNLRVRFEGVKESAKLCAMVVTRGDMDYYIDKQFEVEGVLLT